MMQEFPQHPLNGKTSSWKQSFGVTLYGALDENSNVFPPISFYKNLFRLFASDLVLVF